MNENKRNTLFRRLGNVIKRHLSLTVIVIAALLLELTTGIMYYTSQSILRQTMVQMVEREMNSIYLCIRNQLAKVEVTVDNMAWVVGADLSDPDTMFVNTRRLVENNPSILGSSITFIPDFYPQKGHWFEPYSARRADGTVETMQLGSADHDYTGSEFFTQPIAKEGGHWCEPYMDPDGARAMVTTYGVPVRGPGGRIVAVVDADISLDWLDVVMEESKLYKSTMRFLVTGSRHLLAGEDGPMFQTALRLLESDGDGQGYVTQKDRDGKRHIFFLPVGGMTDWTLINVIDDSDIFGPLRHVRLLLLLLVGLGLAILGFIVYRTVQNMEKLRKVNAEKERIDGELRVAGQIQQSMLPSVSLQHESVDIFGSLMPAREVGGDLFDYFIRDEKLFFCIGDVSGKGTPSAMLMVSAHSLFRAFSVHENNPARIMQAINEASCQGNDTNMFVTLFIGVLDLPTGRLRYCDAGHDAPFVLGAGVTALPVDPHLPAGVFDDVQYSAQEAQLCPGNTVFLYTDGLTEAKDAERQQFGLGRVQEVLARLAGRDCRSQEILETVSEEVHRFVKDASQSDDLTMLAIRYTPASFASVVDEAITLRNDINDVRELNGFQKSIYDKIQLDHSLSQRLRLAVEEAVVNSMEYAYPNGTGGDVEVRIMSDGHCLKVIITDSGTPFDPTSMEKTDTTLPVEDRSVGGLGILLVRELMDAVNYERSGGENVLTLIKYLNDK